MVVSGNTVESLSPKHFLTTYNYVSCFQWFSNKYEQIWSMFLIITSISQAHLENRVILLHGCVLSTISARINSPKTFQSAAFFFFFFFWSQNATVNFLWLLASWGCYLLPCREEEQRSGPFYKEDRQVWKLGTECRKRPKGNASGSIPISLQAELWNQDYGTFT